MVDDDWSEYMKREAKNDIVRNLKEYPNIRKLGLDYDRLAEQALNERRMYINPDLPNKKFNYNIASVLSHPFSVKKSAHYVKIIDYQIGAVIRKYPIFKRNLKSMLIDNFAHAGFVAALCEFFISQGIRIASLEPSNPTNSKRPDIEIILGDKHVFIEAVTPIEALLKAIYSNKDVETELVRIIRKKVSKGQLDDIDSPVILAINVSDPRWSKNFFWNKGFITNEMFFCIKDTALQDMMFSTYHLCGRDLCGLMIKYGDRLFVRPSMVPMNSLGYDEWQKITKIGFARKVAANIFMRNL